MKPLDDLREKWRRERRERATHDEDQDERETEQPSPIDQLREEPDDDRPWRRAR